MAVSEVIEYHQRSKHLINRYAPGPHGLDWANQPDPFRVFAAARVRSAQRRRPVRAFAWVVGLEIVRRRALGTALQSIEWQLASDRGVSAVGVDGWRVRWRIPLRQR